MIVISSGYCASRRGDIFTPSALGEERDVEMMVAGQALLGGVFEHAAQHAAHRVPRQNVVADVILSSRRSELASALA